MCKVIMVGCDLHDATTVLKVADGPDATVRKGFATSNRSAMIEWVKDFASQRGAVRIVFAYEASGQGFGLYDDLTDAGIECHVLAPTHLPHTTHSRKNKTDDKDALMILDEVRAHVLAGRTLPDVWVPNHQTRDDREIVRLRLEVATQRTRLKNQIRNLAKRSRLAFPDDFTSSGDWSKRSVAWLREVAAGTTGALREGVRTALASLMELYQAMSAQIQALDQAIKRLSRTERYARSSRKLKLLSGVGTLTAMVFLTELGDLARFANRRQLAAYLGLAPSAFESGERDDRKGHITKQGPPRVRHVLCQAAWAALRVSPEWKAKYDRIRRGSKSRSRIAIVAIMRQLGVEMWQTARSPELDAMLDERDALASQKTKKTTSARAPQKGAAPSTPPSPRPRRGEAEATATRKGLARHPE
jgi:transposase